MTEPRSALPPDIEGVLTIHRKLLSALLAAAAERDAGFLDRVEAELEYRDAHEDPGAEPDLAFAVESAADAELKRLLASARRTMRLGG
ncbi:hypothetical protein [Prosthecomicrobium sp. N25]|uniref:hypothetical protein n=1 Tax=Prosthecomicrobium sp. N25 TaxID=3129254 RepID=UPI003076E04D